MDHVSHGDVVVLVQLDQTQLVDTGGDEEGLLLLHARPLRHPPVRLHQSLRDEVHYEEARGGGREDEDSVIIDHHGAGVTLGQQLEPTHISRQRGRERPPSNIYIKVKSGEPFLSAN